MSVMRRAWDCPPCDGSGSFVDGEDPSITAECVYCGGTGKLVSAAAYRGAVSLLEQARYCVTYALNCPAHPWHGSDEARKWLIEAARLGGQ